LALTSDESIHRCEGERTRGKLDALLRDVAATGRFVSAHPDVILKSTDTHLYRGADEFRKGFPTSLRSAERVLLSRNRDNAGQGVWKIE